MPRKRAGQNFIQVLTGLYKVKHRVGKKSVQDIRVKLSSFEFVSDKEWLLQKMAVVEKQRR